MFKSSVYIFLLILTGLCLVIAINLIPLAFTETIESSTQDKLQRAHTATLDRVRLQAFETLQTSQKIARTTDLIRAYSPPAIQPEPTATEPNPAKRYPERSAQKIEQLHKEFSKSNAAYDLMVFVDAKGLIIAAKTPEDLQKTFLPTTDIHGVAAIREALSGVSRDGLWNPTPKSPPYMIAATPVIAAREGTWKLVGAVVVGKRIDAGLVNELANSLNPNNNTDAFLASSVVQNGRVVATSSNNAALRDLISINAAPHSARGKTLPTQQQVGHVNTVRTEDNDTVRMLTSALVPGIEGKSLGLVTTVTRKPVATDPIELVTTAIALRDTTTGTGNLWLFASIAVALFLLGLLFIHNEVNRPAVILRQQLDQIEQQGQENLDLNPSALSGSYRDVAVRINKIFNILRKRLERGRSTQSKLMAIPTPPGARDSGSFTPPMNTSAPNIAPPDLKPNPNLAQTNTSPTHLKPLESAPAIESKQSDTDGWTESPAPIPAPPVSRNVRNIEAAAAELMRRLSDKNQDDDPAEPLPPEEPLHTSQDSSNTLALAPTSNIDLNTPVLSDISLHPEDADSTPAQPTREPIGVADTVDLKRAPDLAQALQDEEEAEEFADVPATRQIPRSSPGRSLRNPHAPPNPPGFNNESPEELPPTPVPSILDASDADFGPLDDLSKDATADVPADQMSDLFQRLVSPSVSSQDDVPPTPNPILSEDLDAPFDRDETRAMTDATAQDLLDSSREPDLGESAIAASTQIHAKQDPTEDESPSSMSPHSLLEALKQRGAVQTPAPQHARTKKREEKTEVRPVRKEDLRKSIPPGTQESIAPELVELSGLYEEFMETKRKCGEDDSLSIDKFAQKIHRNRQKLIQKMGCRDVKFTVYVKNGRAALKASPVK